MTLKFRAGSKRPRARNAGRGQGGLPRRSTALEDIPGVGPSIARDLADLGIRRAGDLAGKNPQRLYDRLAAIRGKHQDRCLLYVFRCAVYFAETSRPRPDLLLWWNWKDR